MTNKYRNVKTVVDGIHFDSKIEAERYKVLKLLKKCGNITNLEVHPKFVLLKGFTDNKGKKVSQITYSADFRYIDLKTNSDIVEDVKSEATEKDKAFVIKWKLARYIYPEIDFRVVK